VSLPEVNPECGQLQRPALVARTDGLGLFLLLLCVDIPVQAIHLGPPQILNPK
jgi:hypothetical protein